MKKIIITSSLFAGLIFSGCGTKLSNDTVINSNGKEGLLKSSGEVSIKPIYGNMGSFKGKNKSYYHPNHFNFHNLHDNPDQTYAVVKSHNNKMGIIDKQGELKLKPVYDSISSFYNGFARVELNGKQGLVNEKFEVVLKPVYDEVQEFDGDTAVVKLFGKFGCIDKQMNFKVKPVYDMIYLESEGFKRISLENKWGFMDKECNVVTKPVYDYAYDYRNGFAKVKKGELWGFLDTEGKQLSGQIFDDPDRF